MIWKSSDDQDRTRREVAGVKHETDSPNQEENDPDHPTLLPVWREDFVFLNSSFFNFNLGLDCV